MNLIIEQGNSLTKIAAFHNGRLLTASAHPTCRPQTLAPLFQTYRLRRGIMSSVAQPHDDLLPFLRQRLSPFIFFDQQTALPFDVRYQTPDTLGKDRLAAVAGARCLYPNKNILIIDAGTAITYEVLEAQGAYLGGNISPGMDTRFKALNHFTHNLPLIAPADNIPLIGYSTETAIQSGVIHAIAYEMDGFINDLRSLYPDLTVLLTGGHASRFVKQLKNPTFAIQYLTLIGLNAILHHNVVGKKHLPCGSRSPRSAPLSRLVRAE